VVREIRILVPDEIYNKLRKIGEELRVSMQDLMLRAIVKALEDFEKIEKRARRGRAR